MNAQTERLTLSGPAGAIEAVRDAAALADGAAAPRGVAIIAHPHPLFGGTMDNKVVQTLARAFVQCGWTAVRFNFRGVGATQGVHDEGRGELQDLLAGRDAPTALFCSNDQLAMTVIRDLRRMGLRVPEDVSVAGFDGVRVGEWMTPVLSTVVQPNADIGRTALVATAGTGDAAQGDPDRVTLDVRFHGC